MYQRHLLGKNRVCELFEFLNSIWQWLDKLCYKVTNIQKHIVTDDEFARF